MDQPWENEPDEAAFEAHGLQCRIIRTKMLHLCGYVGVSKEHPAFGKGEQELGKEINAHGGLTWTHNRLPNKEPDGLWWLGFDCAHAGDLVPKYARRSDWHGEEYRDMKYVKDQCETLAHALQSGVATGENNGQS